MSVKVVVKNEIVKLMNDEGIILNVIKKNCNDTFETSMYKAKKGNVTLPKGKSDFVGANTINLCYDVHGIEGVCKLFGF